MKLDAQRYRSNRSVAIVCSLLIVLVGSTAPSTQASAAVNRVEAVEGRACMLTVGESTLTVQWQGDMPDVGRQGICDWILRSAQIVRGYYESFPVRAVTITVKTIDSHAMGAGRTVGFLRPASKSLSDDMLTSHHSGRIG